MNAVSRRLHLQPANSFIQSRFYDYLFKRKIVYNACMEDPAVDIELMDFERDSRVCMLASAGCNALHYAMDGAGHVDCVDANPCQYALVDLKLAVSRLGDHDALWKLFSDGVSPEFRSDYKRLYREELQPISRTFWDQNLQMFDLGRTFKGFHFRTGCGFITQCCSLLGKDAKRAIERYFELEDLDEQQAAFDEVLLPYYDHFLLKAIIWFTVRFGVPSRQMRMIHHDAREVLRRLRDRVRASLTKIPARENYFHYLYFFGRYSPECCPEYLKKNRFDELVDSLGRVRIHNSYLADHLERAKSAYTYFCLLDHLDWLHHDPALLARQWKAVLRRAQVGTKILIRTYLDDNKWMAPFVQEHAHLLPQSDVQQEVARDRVGIYTRTHLLEVTSPA